MSESDKKKAERKKRQEEYKRDPDKMMRELEYPLENKDKNLNVKKGDNTRYLNKNIELFSMGKPDLGNPEEVKDRIARYFEVCKSYDAKPSVTSLAMALGMNRFTLYEIVSGKDYTRSPGAAKKIDEESREAIRAVYSMMDAIWEDYMLNGKINPASGIFLGKNHFGYQDTKEHIFTHEKVDREEINIDEIKSKYITGDK